MSDTIDVQTDFGVVNFRYTISTPSDTHAATVNPALPSVVFLHPFYIPQQVFHAQFIDPQLRRFNLIAFGARGQGQSKGIVPRDYSPMHAASDLHKLLKALNVQKCHVVSMSLSSICALRYAINYPDSVLSLSCISPAPLSETADTRESMTQVHECWEMVMRNCHNQSIDSLVETVTVALPSAANEDVSDFSKALLRESLTNFNKTWIMANFEDFSAATNNVIVDRIPPSFEELARVTCSIRLIFGSADIVYHKDDCVGLESTLRAAGIKVDPLYIIPDAPHFCNMVFADEINPILVELMMETNHGEVPPIPRSVQSPYLEWLMASTRREDLGDSDDEEDLYIVTPIHGDFKHLSML